MTDEHFTEGGPVNTPDQETLPERLKSSTSCFRPVKSEYGKFSAEFAQKLHKTTVARMIEAVQQKYDSNC